MRWGMGVLRWAPSEFWRATPVELNRAMEGWQEAHGIDPEHPDHPPGTVPDAEEVRFLQDLMEKHEAIMEERNRN